MSDTQVPGQSTVAEQQGWQTRSRGAGEALLGRKSVRGCPQLCLKPLMGRRDERGSADEFAGGCSFVRDFSGGRQTDAELQRQQHRLMLFCRAPQEIFFLIRWPFALRRSVKPLLEVRSAKVGQLCQRTGNLGLNPKHLPQKRHQEDGLALTAGCWRSAHDRSKKGQRYKLSFCFQLIQEDPKQKISSCSFLWNGPDLG